MATPQRLPIVNQDDGTWGDIIRQFLMKEHFNDDDDGNTANGGHKTVTIRAGTAAAGTAPLKFTSGTLLSSPETGAMEFNGDSLYFTITSGTTRKKVAIYDDNSGAAGDVYYRDSSGYFKPLPIGSTDQVLKVSGGGLPVWGAAPGGAFAVDTKTGNYTMTSSDTVVLVDASGNDVTITLPAASGVDGVRFYIKRLDGSNHTVTVTHSGSDTIDGAASMTIDNQYDIVELVSDGSAWYVLSYTTSADDASVTGEITFRSIATATNSSTCNKPSGTVAGDVMIAYYIVYDVSSVTFTPPSGWTAIGSKATQGTGNRIISQAFYKVAGGGEPSSYTFSKSAGNNPDLAIASYSGVDTSNPADTSSANNGSGTTRTGTGVTTTAANDKVLLLTAGYTGVISSSPSGMTQRTLWDSVNYVYDIDVASAGATGNYTATQSSDTWTANVVALKAATTPANPMYFATNTQTTNYTVTDTDTVVFADATSNDVTITLPAASGVMGYRFYIKRIDGSGHTVTVQRTSSDTIDGMTSFTLDLQYTAFGVVSNGTAWYIL